MINRPFELSADTDAAFAPYLLRPIRDKESGLGAELIALLMERNIDGETGELALTCAIAMWATQKRLIGDPSAIPRLANNAQGLADQGRFNLRVGEDFVRFVQGEIESGRRMLDQATPGELEAIAPVASGKLISIPK